MDLKLPPGFEHVGTAEARPPSEFVAGIIGIVVDYQPPTPSRGVDWMMTFKLTDHCYYNEGQGHMGVNVRIFAKEVNMPTVESLGDVVLIRGLKRMDFHGSPFLVSHRSSYEIMCFPASTISEPAFKHAFGAGQAPPHTKHPFGAKSSAEENYYVIALRDWASGLSDLPRTPVQQLVKARNEVPRRLAANIPSRPPPQAAANTFNRNSLTPSNASRGTSRPISLPPRPPMPQPSASKSISTHQDQKFSLLKDIQNGTFVTLVGEVRKLWGTLNVCQMYLTDYTSNSLLYDYKLDVGQVEGQDGDEHGYLANTSKKGWKGPFGKMTLQISLWPPHDAFASAEVEEGDIVLVRNVHITFQDKYLEGKLHTDKKFPCQVDVRRIPQHHPRVLALKARRTEYEEQKLAAENKRPPQSKAEKKKKRKKLKEKERQAKSQQEEGKANSGDEEKGVAKNKMNTNVIAGNEHQPCLTVSDFINTPHLQTRDASGNPMTLPFINQRVRTRVRVVDYAPDDIRSFARSLGDESYHDRDPRSGAPSPPNIRNNEWEWAFYILVEDAKPAPGEEAMQLPVQVFGDEAIKLLGIAPIDLHRNPKILNLLKGKLWTLWGDLEEVKSAGRLEGGSSNKPIECCVKEFGVEDGDGDGWVRTHAICDTRIE